MKNSIQLLNQTIAQLAAIKKMQAEKRSCSEILVQIKAAKSLLNTFVTKFLETNLERCRNHREAKGLISELIKNS